MLDICTKFELIKLGYLCHNMIELMRIDVIFKLL